MSTSLSSLAMLPQASEPKNPAAQQMAILRRNKLTPERRSEIARKAAKARWKKKKRKR